METPPPEIHGFFRRWAPCEPTESGLPPAPVTVNGFPCDPYGMLWKAAVANPRRPPDPTSLLSLSPLKGGPSVDTARCHVHAPPNASFPAAREGSNFRYVPRSSGSTRAPRHFSRISPSLTSLTSPRSNYFRTPFNHASSSSITAAVPLRRRRLHHRIAPLLFLSISRTLSFLVSAIPLAPDFRLVPPLSSLLRDRPVLPSSAHWSTR